jgi:hypothetical protein
VRRGMLVRHIDRPPYPDEVAHARSYANRLRQAITQGTRQIDKRTPGGRFDGRAYARGRAEQAAGRPVSSHQWRVTRQVAAPIQEPHVGLIIDTSGSMAGYEYALGPIAWILTEGLRHDATKLDPFAIGHEAICEHRLGRVVLAVYGRSAARASDPRSPGARGQHQRWRGSEPRPAPPRACRCRSRVGISMRSQEPGQWLADRVEQRAKAAEALLRGSVSERRALICAA